MLAVCDGIEQFLRLFLAGRFISTLLIPVLRSLPIELELIIALRFARLCYCQFCHIEQLSEIVSVYALKGSIGKIIPPGQSGDAGL